MIINDRFVKFKTDNERVLSHPYINDVLVYDIECDSFDLDTSRVKFVGFYSYKYEKYILLHIDNHERIQGLINEHRILVGFNNKFFDGPIMENPVNGFDLKYKIVFDCLSVLYDMERRRPNREVIIKNPDGKMLASILKNRKLNSVAEALNIPVSKGDIDYKLFQKDEWSDAEIQEIFIYLYKDINITRQIFEYYITYFDGFRDLVPDDNIKRLNYIRSSTGSFAYSVVCHLADIPLVFEDDKEKLKLKPDNGGGYVLAPQVEYAENVVYLDFASLYPHLVFQCNLLTPADEGWSGDGFFPVKGTYDKTSQGKIDKILKDIYMKRRELKRAKDPRELGYKIAINSIYGISGSPVFKNVFNTTTAGDCTAIGRKTIQFTRDQFEAHGYKVIYGDTDSVFVQLPNGKTVQNLLDLSKSVIATIQAHMPFPVSTFVLDVDDEFDKVWLFKKKHYAGFNKDGKFIIKGLSIIKGDASQLAQLLFDKIRPLMIEKKDIKFDREYIANLIDIELKKNITIIGSLYNVRNPDSYKSASSLQCQIATEHGAGSHVLIPNKIIGDVGKSKKYCTPEEAVDLKIEDLCLDKLWHELDPFIKRPKDL